jgi:hypothetical protein
MTEKSNEAQINHDSRIAFRKLLGDAVRGGFDLNCAGEDMIAEVHRIHWTVNAYFARKAGKIHDSMSKEGK